jgi:putative component of membrane protein insertase Oxa1/YidC/SpoIIIJ protein YidD
MDTSARPPKRRFVRIALLALLALVLLDAFRRPQDQCTAAAYVGAVRVYQSGGSPVVRTCGVRCPFHPTCSEYSAQAVQTHGIGFGLALTGWRLCRCNGTAAPGTEDPIPPAD